MLNDSKMIGFANRQVTSLCEKGLYGAALHLAKEGCEMAERMLGADHPGTGVAHNNLGYVLWAVGDLAAARPHLERALDIHRGALGDDHADTLGCHNNLGLLLYRLGDLDGARECFGHVLETRIDTQGGGHPDTVAARSNLASVLNVMGDYEAARDHLEQALADQLELVGEDHEATATIVANLGGVYRSLDAPAQALPCFERALVIRRKVLGENHPDVALSLNNLADCCAAMGRTEKAISLMRQAAAIDDSLIGRVARGGSEQQRLAIAQTVRDNLEAFLSIVLCHYHDVTEAVGEVFDLVLRRKAVAAESSAVQRDAILAGAYPHLRAELQELATVRAQIARAEMDGPSDEGTDEYRRQLAARRRKRDQLESGLAHQIPEMNLAATLQAADRKAVATAVPLGAALVEVVRCSVFDFGSTPVRGGAFVRPARYLAFVIRGGDPDSVRMIDLGEAEPIEAMIASFRTAIIERTEVQATRDFGASRTEPAGASGDVGQGGPLRQATFDKLAPVLDGCTHLFLAPDGDLSRLPFEVLPTADGGRLIDEYTICYLSCGRDVLRFGTRSGRMATPPVVAADPDFDLQSGQPISEEVAGEPGARHSRDLDRGRLRFQPLTGTRIEGERIAALLGVRPWTGPSVLKGRLTSCRSPRILHLATHGFFLGDQAAADTPERLAGNLAGRLADVSNESPLLRSGLALAGANTWLRGESTSNEVEDGILTAEDVSGMDLLETDLAVLSACETGLGQVHIGEGVFGLRRAFILAGAKTLVMSLWRVPDEQTRALMEDFYERLLAGMGRTDALRAAQLALKFHYPEPYYWGAFICQGEPGPLPPAASPSP